MYTSNVVTLESPLREKWTLPMMFVYSYILILDTLPEINGLPLKVDGWKMNFLLGPRLFLGDMLVSGSVLMLDNFLIPFLTHSKRLLYCMCHTTSYTPYNISLEKWWLEDDPFLDYRSELFGSF